MIATIPLYKTGENEKWMKMCYLFKQIVFVL